VKPYCLERRGDSDLTIYPLIFNAKSMSVPHFGVLRATALSVSGYGCYRSFPLHRAPAADATGR